MSEQGQQGQQWRGAPERSGAPPQDRAAGNAELAVPVGGPVTDLDQMWRLAANLSMANLLPAKLVGRKSDVFAMVLYGNDLGLSAMQAIQGIHVVEGRPSLGAHTWAALMERHGHRVFTPCRVALATGRICSRTPEHPIHDPDNVEALAHDYEPDHDDTRCRLRVVRDDGRQFETVWDVDRAIAAGLLVRMPEKARKPGEPELQARSSDNKPMPWELHRPAMLYARCMSEVCKRAAPSVAMGFYSEDEAEEIARRERAERVVSQRLDRAMEQDRAEAAERGPTVEQQVDEVERLLTDPPAAGMPPAEDVPDGTPETLESAGHTITLIGDSIAGYIWVCQSCFPDDRDMDVHTDDQARMPREDAIADHAHYAGTNGSA